MNHHTFELNTISTRGKTDIHSGAKWFQFVDVHFADGSVKTWRCVPDTLLRRLTKQFKARAV